MSTARNLNFLKPLGKHMVQKQSHIIRSKWLQKELVEKTFSLVSNDQSYQHELTLLLLLVCTSLLLCDSLFDTSRPSFQFNLQSIIERNFNKGYNIGWF